MVGSLLKPGNQTLLGGSGGLSKWVNNGDD